MYVETLNWKSGEHTINFSAPKGTKSIKTAQPIKNKAVAILKTIFFLYETAKKIKPIIHKITIIELYKGKSIQVIFKSF